MLKKAIAAARKEKAKTVKARITPQHMQEFKEAFEAVDADGSGEIDETELRMAMAALGFQHTKDEIRRMIKSLDSDGSGTLGFEEFVSLMTNKSAKKEPKQEIKDAFSLLDKGSKGFISLEDLRLAAQELRETVSDEQLEAMLKLADVDGDGKVDGTDLYKTLKKTSAL
ncbi:hypothetical protein CEUSTIGMA_g305.t1 [Chlamydomonas eustigma]|uniref:EF-hand domain-containing protein n=1 Tax=Chlamydomonas eustigma TaxID=1157962 RepID=A0A250WQM5_9CHLO|nr:hypothetical protein CEUSTIGMA_g305.t1 [Chlamydomonas eustigma]|eukprot:GAX72850.1 hypothetical protein CEUSTIGMA_g305.t1 [Chlamydomonas eustigma]